MSRIAFISHASQDAEAAQKICNYIEGQGISCWIAPRDVRPGHEFAAEIMTGLGSCRVIVLLLSEHANNSIYVKREIERAVSAGKPVFPVRIREVTPSQTLEFFVASSQWIDAWKPPIEQYLDQLTNAIRSAVNLAQDMDEAAPRPMPPKADKPAMEPKKRGVPGLAIAAGALLLVGVGGWFGYQALQGSGTQSATQPVADAGSVPPVKAAPRQEAPAASVTTSPDKTPATTSASAGGAVSQKMEDILKGIEDKKGNARYQAVKALADTSLLPEQMSVTEVQALIGDSTYAQHLLTPLVKRLPQPLNYAETMQLLDSMKGNERYQTLKLLSDNQRIPTSLSADQALAIAGDSSYQQHVRGILVNSLPKPLSYDGAIKILDQTSKTERYNTIKLLHDNQRLPEQLNADQLLSLLGDSTYTVNAVDMLQVYLPDTGDYNEVHKIVGGSKGTERYNLINLLLKNNKLPVQLTVDQMLALMDTSAYTRNLIDALTPRLPESLAYADLMKMVTPFKGNERYQAIKSLADHKRVPSGLSNSQVDALVEGSAYQKQARVLLQR